MAGPPRPVRLRTRRKMSLRPLLDIAHSDERFRRLAAAAREPAPAAAGASAAIRPYLVAALAEDPAGLAGRPLLVVAPDDIAARDLAREAGAFVAPRRVRLYPSRGTGYASHLAPPPHLVGLRIAALDALTGWRGEGEPPLVVASATALAEAIPDASLRPGGGGDGPAGERRVRPGPGAAAPRDDVRWRGPQRGARGAAASGDAWIEL